MPSAATLARPDAAPASGDKRDAILDAALRVIARLGLTNAPMSAVAKEAGVAAGTLYLYFPSKEAMLNALYVELLEDRRRAMTPDAAPVARDLRAALWAFWHPLARWHLDHPEKSSVLHQCQASGVLTEASRERHQRMDVEDFARFDDAVARGMLRPLSRAVCWALLVGPILVLARLRDEGEIAATPEQLRETFDGVCRSILPA